MVELHPVRTGLDTVRASSLRSRAGPAALLAKALVRGGAICLFAAQPPFGVPLGLAVAALGVWLIRTDSATDWAARVQASTD